MEEYNADGFLPIHEAAFRGYVTAVERFIDQQVDNEDDEDEENGAKREIILYDQLESRSIDDLRLTPLMAATVGGSRDVVQSLIKLGAKVTATDSQNRTIVGIAIMKQNVDLILYFNEQTYAPSLDIWNTIVKLFSSQTNDNECIAAARIIELLTREKYLNDYWPLLVNCGVMKHLIDMLNTCTIDDVLISCLLILLNVINIYPDVKHRFIQNDCAKAFVQVKKLSKQIVTLYGHVLSRLCDQSECIHALVHNEIIKEIHNILHMDNSFVSPILIYPYFDSLSKIALAKREYQLLIQYQTQIVQRTIYYLEMFDRQLTISIYHFIRELVMKNEEQQIIIAKNLNLTAFLFSSLHSTQHDVQRSAVECIQAIVEQNHETQMMIMDQGGVEQLMNLLRKSNIQMLRIAIICTLWSLTGNSHARRRKMAITIGVKTLVEFFSLRSTDYLLTIVEAIGELARLVRTKYMHYQLEIGRKHCISPFVRMLKFDNDLLVLSCLRTLQNLCLTPTYIPCRQNQTILRKADGISQLVNLIKMSKNEVIQAEATLGLTCALFGKY
ncbi:unnamed protein product [Didymodactylos carnosus]|uniref:Uncharacterized protein n=1 Tax=Didymodactylos carnosus TaxID=1234261 RepID=A0A8S2MX98_9BILA|nr:unnamed protein product [Didymodactylos carnosus]CAF3975330.1 unnamed protein product [Didymodactylos carnosus]